MSANVLVLASLIAGCGTVGDRPGRRDSAAKMHGAAARQPAAARPARFTVTATGDFLLHDTLIAQGAADARTRGRGGYDFRPMLAQLEPVIGGSDLGICHIETPVGSRRGPYSGYPIFNSPPQIVSAVRSLGYDTCSTASNHALDQGTSGVRRTLAALDAAGIKHAGTARDAAEATRINLLDVKGVKVAHLAYAYGTNGMPKPSGRPWAVNSPLNARRILADARRARAAGAEAVITSLHWGEEYRHQPTAEQTALARRLTASPDVDLIVGHHAHVVQPFDKVGGKWVAYGVGNQVSNPSANQPSTHQGIVARFAFARTGGGRWQVTPSFVPTLVVPGPPIRLLAFAKEGERGAAAVRRGRQAGREATGEAPPETARIVRSLGEKIPAG